MKFLDLFAGIGGFRLGMESAGQITTKLAKLSSGIVQVDWHQLPKQPDLKPKPNKRNGTLDRRQAFGGLFNRGGVTNG